MGPRPVEGRTPARERADTLGREQVRRPEVSARACACLERTHLKDIAKVVRVASWKKLGRKLRHKQHKVVLFGQQSLRVERVAMRLHNATECLLGVAIHSVHDKEHVCGLPGLHGLWEVGEDPHRARATRREVMKFEYHFALPGWHGLRHHKGRRGRRCAAGEHLVRGATPPSHQARACARSVLTGRRRASKTSECAIVRVTRKPSVHSGLRERERDAAGLEGQRHDCSDHRDHR